MPPHRSLLLLPSLLYALLFLATRVSHVIDGYREVTGKRLRNAKFLANCADEHFRHGLGEHESLCDVEEQASQTSPLWHGLRRAFEKTYLCGDTPCTELVSNPYTLGVLAIGVLLMPYMLRLYAHSEDGAGYVPHARGYSSQQHRQQWPTQWQPATDDAEWAAGRKRVFYIGDGVPD